MLKALAIFALAYALLSGLLLLPTPLALHAPWCYPPFAFAAAILATIAAPQRLFPFTLIALPPVHLLNFALLVGDTVWYIGLAHL